MQVSRLRMCGRMRVSRRNCADAACGAIAAEGAGIRALSVGERTAGRTTAPWGPCMAPPDDGGDYSIKRARGSWSTLLIVTISIPAGRLVPLGR